MYDNKWKSEQKVMGKQKLSSWHQLHESQEQTMPTVICNDGDFSSHTHTRPL